MGREGFEDWVLNRLSELGEIAVRPMFGGHGFYWRDVIFGMVFRDRLYFKVDARVDPTTFYAAPRWSGGPSRWWTPRSVRL
jgi:TfoX/Sxy family transcriptional regulator of competence genes